MRTVTTPVRVCFLIDELAAAGTETQLLALIRHVDRSRVQPYLVLLRGESERSQSLEPSNCPVLRLGVGSLKSPRTALKALSFMRFLWQERIDVVQAYFPDSSYFGVPTAFLAGVPYRLRTRNNIGHWMTRAHKILGRVLNSLTTATIANCQAAKDALIRDERPRADRVFVLENGVDLDRFLTLGPPPGNQRVGAVANLRPVKGLDVLVSAAARLRQRFPQATFQIAGEGDQRPSLEEQIRRAGLEGRFQLVGSRADVPAFLGELDIAVLSSRAEGMSNAVLEYMAAGRPIVATAVGAMPELIADGEQGLLVPAGDPETLALAIGRILESPDLGRRLGESARRRAMEQYSRQACVRRFEDFYLHLVQSSKRARHATHS